MRKKSHEKTKKDLPPQPNMSEGIGNNNMFRYINHFFVVLSVLLCWSYHTYHIYNLFENVRFFSHLADFEREMAYRTEMGLYFSYYKTLVFSESYTKGFNTIVADNRTEFGHTINTLQRFNLYPEVFISFIYRVFKYLSNIFGWSDQVCWNVNRGHGLPPIESCEGPGNYHYFYIYSVFLISGSVLSSVFLHGYVLSGNFIGALLTALSFIYNHGEATRVQWTPPLRESFAYPIFAAQMLLLTHILKTKKCTRTHFLLLTILDILFCLFWQFSQFIIFTQLFSLMVIFALEAISKSMMTSLLISYTVSFFTSLLLLFGNQMFLGSLYFSSLLTTFLIVLLRPFLSRSLKFRPYFILVHLLLFLTLCLGIKEAMQRVFNITEDTHIMDILLSKFTNFASFHTRLYTCAAEFDFLGLEVIQKLASTWLLPIAFSCFLIFSTNYALIELRDGNKWLWRSSEHSENLTKTPPEQIFNFFQLMIFSAMALLIMRLKLFATPQLCAISSLVSNSDFFKPVFGRFAGKLKWILVPILLAGISKQGILNLREQWSMRGEYSNPAQERLFLWINKETDVDAVFAGSMAVMANVKLSTGRPIVNHPHYESEIVRNRTLQVYSMYSRKPLKEVHSTLKTLGVQFFVFQPELCGEHPKPECSYLAMWDLEDPQNAERSSLCQQIWEGILAGDDSKIRPFRIVYSDNNTKMQPSYVVLSLN